MAIIYIGEKKRKASECIIWEKRREVSNRTCNRMCLLGATHNVRCSMASAAVVGATVFGAAAVGSVVFGAAD